MTTDPFEALREPRVPLAPAAEFTNDLRSRLEVALGLPTREEHHMEVREYTPSRLHAFSVNLTCRGADRAIEWYTDVFGARVIGEPIVMDDGIIGHAELLVGDTVFMLADEYPVEDVRSPEELGGNSVTMMLYVPDVDATFARALELGAAQLRSVETQHGARMGVLRDPFGHRWFVGTALEADDIPVEDAPGRRFGDIGYMTLEAPDGDRARRFFGALFGWDTRPSGPAGSYHINSITPPAGIHGGADVPEVKLYFRVDDIQRVAARVRELGGEVLSINDYASGGNAECVDDQGIRFDLFRPRAGY